MTFQDTLKKVDLSKVPSWKEDIVKTVKMTNEEFHNRSVEFLQERIKYPEQQELLDYFTFEKMRDVDNWSLEDFEKFSILMLTT